jgi:hypothetical protein
MQRYISTRDGVRKPSSSAVGRSNPWGDSVDLQNRASTAHKTSCRQNESTAVFCMQNHTQISQNKLEIYKKYFANRAFGCNLI